MLAENKYFIDYKLCALLLAWMTAIMAPDTSGQEPVLQTQRFSLHFSADGHPLSFRTTDSNRELLVTNDPGSGFYLMIHGEFPLRLEQVKIENGNLVASCAEGLPRVTFRIHEADAYLALHIVRFEAVPSTPEYSLHFQMNLLQPVGVLELDYMTEAQLAGNSTVSVDWRHIWNRNPENPKGGFALYLPEDDDDEDETILNIWVNEGLPHPKIEGEWNLYAAQEWVKRWLNLYGDQSCFWISARTPEELYAAVPYAETAGVRDVYLFTDTWRGGDKEPFWPNSILNWGINAGVFPKGEEDLRAFSDYLHEREMNLKLHWVSGGIGFRDPIYVANKPDERLASWGRGTIVEELSKRGDTILFRPAHGVSMPFHVPSTSWWHYYTGFPAFHPCYDFNLFAVGNELVRVGKFSDTDKDVWRLENLQRSLGSTHRSEHSAGEAARGLISAYGVQLVPENDSSLVEEMAANFADMLNRCHVANVEYDGAEIHMYNGRSWGFYKFASLVYRHLDHPVTAYSSSGNAPPCNLEYRLNATKHTWHDRQKGIVPILLDQPFRSASNLLDAHWGMSQVCAHGYTRYNIMKPEPLFGIDIYALKGHGLTSELLSIARDWKRVNELITPEQRSRIRETMYYKDDFLQQAGHHEKSELVHVLSKGAGQWEIYPTKVLTRSGNEDTLWKDGQEHGAISPRQYLKPGYTLHLVNPFAMQVPMIVMRVLWGFHQEGDLEEAGTGTQADNRGADRNFDYAAMILKKGDGKDSGKNFLLQPCAEELRNTGDTRFRDEGGGLVIEANNPLGKSTVNEENLPEWSRSLDMNNHRGIGAWVTGDNSGAVLTIQIPGGDYVIPINFIGRRYIEIPNAQVAWSTGYWGWRMGSKHPDYSNLGWLKMGFGYLPPESQSQITVEKLTALREVDTELKNPVLSAGDTRLAIKGSIASGQYLTWEGGPFCSVYDANWNKKKELSVECADFHVPAGAFDFNITSDETPTSPWIEIQVLAKDTPIIIPDMEL